MGNKKFVLGAIIGTAVGAALGVLFAPRSGKETREMINEKSKECVKKGKEIYDKEKVVVEKMIEEKKDDTKKAIKEAADKVSEKMS
jgi:gas vesicle protein